MSLPLDEGSAKLFSHNSDHSSQGLDELLTATCRNNFVVIQQYISGQRLMIIVIMEILRKMFCDLSIDHHYPAFHEKSLIPLSLPISPESIPIRICFVKRHQPTPDEKEKGAVLRIQESMASPVY